MPYWSSSYDSSTLLDIEGFNIHKVTCTRLQKIISGLVSEENIQRENMLRVRCRNNKALAKNKN